MSTLEPLIPTTTIASVAFVALRQTLRQSSHFIRERYPNAVVYIVQETSLGFCPIQADQLQASHFTLVVSQVFSGLLLANARPSDQVSSTTSTVDTVASEPGGDRPDESPPQYSTDKAATRAPENGPGNYGDRADHCSPPDGDELRPGQNLENGRNDADLADQYDINLVFEPEAIAHFLQQLLAIVPPNNSLQASLHHGLHLVRPNQSALQSQFTMHLVGELVQTLDLKKRDLGTFLSFLSPLQTSDPPGSVVLETLTEEKQMLHQIAHQTEAEDRTKSEFLATMSHELRTPLTYILGMSATLLRWSNPGTGDGFPDRQRRYLQNIHDQGEHLLELINDLLDLSQLESGRLGLEFQEFSLSLLVQQSLNVYRKKAQQKGVVLELDSHLTVESDRITADPHRLQQVISNLLSNAIKFTPQAGKVTVRLSADSHLLEIQVRDTGIGIPEQHRHTIFQKFTQLDSSYHREYEGTGLGLALTKQLVDLHGGWIECDSTVDVGTVFTVKLPRHPFSLSASLNLPKRPLDASYPLGRIVLLDDNNENGHLVSEMLTAAGYQVVWILEGLTAISQLEMLQPAIVIVNDQLIHTGAGMMNIVQILRKNPMTKRMKIIVLAHRSHGNTGAEAASEDGWMST